MKSERWQEIERIFQTALELDPRKRAAFLDETCGSDPEVRSEVESLISFHEKGGGLMEGIAFSEGMRAVAGAQPEDLTIGQSLGSYEIIARLGEGGMAAVYLARDTRLGRSVALKTLQSDIARDESGMRRFRQEARAASSLNHPNIVTIHEIAQVDGVHFIATEFIDGETLRSRISQGPLSLAEVLDVAAQVASALSAAHRSGIIHRDIKPENIMLRSDGYAKVLDFGLAKLTRSHTPFAELLKAGSALSTQPGIIMGTIRYMSPEQARGLDMDERTDIWSLGVVLYEMIVGRAPFEGATPTDVIVAILEREPVIPSPSAQEIPDELVRIVARCLAKEKLERYQTIDELLAEIRRLKQQIEIKAHLERSDFSESTGKSEEGQGIIGSRALTSTPRDGPARITRHRALTVGVILMILAAIGVVLLGVYSSVGKRIFSAGSASHFVAEAISRLTTDGKVQIAALSPDGKYIAYVVADLESEGLVVRQVADTASNQILAPAALKFRGLTFSPNSNEVYYVAAENNKKVSNLYRVSILGGSPRRILANVDSPISFSLDGKRFAFVRDYPDSKESGLIIAQTDSGEERVLAIRKEPNHFSSFGPAWSPDGKVLATSVLNEDSQGTYMSVIEVQESDGSQRAITRDRWPWIEQVAWLKDGSGLIISAKDTESTQYRVYEIGYPGGETRTVTNDLGEYHGVSVTADSAYLVSVQREELPSIWVASANNDYKHPVQLTRERGRAYSGISWTRDGKIAYASIESGNPDIWLMDADGKNQKQLTTDIHTDYSPAVSRDGQYIVFGSDRAGSRNIWRMDIDGSHPVRLTEGGGEYAPQCTPDGWVVYTSYSDTAMLWKVPLAGGKTIRLSFGNYIYGVFSPDGQSIVCRHKDESDESEPSVAVFPLSGENSKPVFFNLPIASGASVKWTADGRALTYVASRNGAYNIWNQPTNGGSPKQLTDISSNKILDFAWSSDGKSLAYLLSARVQNVVLMGRSKGR